MGLTAKVTQNGYPQSILGIVDTTLDAWGRQKVYNDKSMLSALFTYDVPNKTQKEMHWNGIDDYIEQTSFIYATSVEGSLHLTTSATVGSRTQLRTKEHVRYQPNRGFLYSSSILLPEPTKNSIRKFGSFLPCNGVYFKLVGDGNDYKLYFVVKNHFIEDTIDITPYLPIGYDLTKGNLYDIQMQWRGIGDFKIYFNQELIYVTSELGKRDKVSVENPSLPISFEVENTGDVSTIVCGCADLTMEGGKDITAKYNSFSTGVAMINCSKNNSNGTAILAIRMPYKINYGGDNVCYSRDAILDQISTFCKDEAIVSVYIGRGVYLSNLPSLTWNSRSDEFIEYLTGGDDSDLDTAFQNDKNNMYNITAVRHEKDFALRMINPSPKKSPFSLTADTYLVVQLVPDGSSQKAGCTIEISEQI